MTEQFPVHQAIKLVSARALAPMEAAFGSSGDMIPCECCGMWCYPEYHHRKFRSRGGDWRPSNVLALAPACHHRVTTCHTGRARELGLSVSQWARPEEVPVAVWYADQPVLLDNLGGYTLDNG